MERQFAAAGWNVVEVKYGHQLRAKFAEPGGEAIRTWIDAMPNEQYQSMFALAGDELRKQFLDGAPTRSSTCSPASPTTSSRRCCRTSAATTWRPCSRRTPRPTR